MLDLNTTSIGLWTQAQWEASSSQRSVYLHALSRQRRAPSPMWTTAQWEASTASQRLAHLHDTSINQVGAPYPMWSHVFPWPEPDLYHARAKGFCTRRKGRGQFDPNKGNNKGENGYDLAVAGFMLESGFKVFAGSLVEAVGIETLFPDPNDIQRFVSALSYGDYLTKQRGKFCECKARFVKLNGWPQWYYGVRIQDIYYEKLCTSEHAVIVFGFASPALQRVWLCGWLSVGAFERLRWTVTDGIDPTARGGAETLHGTVHYLPEYGYSGGAQLTRSMDELLLFMKYGPL